MMGYDPGMSESVQPIITGLVPGKGQSYHDYLSACGVMGRGFAYREIVSMLPSRRRTMPPRTIWPRIVPTLGVAIELRSRMILRHGVEGLRVHAAFRPVGGAPSSRHKKNEALDLDLLRADASEETQESFYVEASALWGEVGESLEMGLGLYCVAGRRRGIRVHIDTGFRFRTWQKSGTVYILPPLAESLAAESVAVPIDPVPWDLDHDVS
jgi:hypothetical protein